MLLEQRKMTGSLDKIEDEWEKTHAGVRNLEKLV